MADDTEPTLPPDLGGPVTTHYASALDTPVRTGMATTSLVLGILALIPGACLPIAGQLLGLIAIILGIIALTRSSAEPLLYGGRGKAIGGICTGGASLVIVVPVLLMISILLPSLARARELAKRAVCRANLRGIGQACLVYAADDARDSFPLNLQMLITDGSVGPEVLTSPLDPNARAVSYSYVTGLTEDDQDDWIVAFANPAYSNGEGASMLFLDGHVEFVKEPNFTGFLDAFKKEYEAARGEPPVILPPQ